MALEAVVYPQDPFSYISCKDFTFHNLYFPEQENQDPQETKNNINLDKEQGFVSNNYNGNKSGDSDDYIYNESIFDTENQLPASDVAVGGGRRKRRRTRSSKNKEEIENQRMTHIAVERNRRKQMNEYLAVLRSLMPIS